MSVHVASPLVVDFKEMFRDEILEFLILHSKKEQRAIEKQERNCLEDRQKKNAECAFSINPFYRKCGWTLSWEKQVTSYHLIPGTVSSCQHLIYNTFIAQSIMTGLARF